jgi:hypothetical protein
MENKYYCITAHTPFVGEVNDYFYKGDRDTSAFYQFADDCVAENAYEWMDDESLECFDGDECEYFAECYYDVKEITKEEYEENCVW